MPELERPNPADDPEEFEHEDGCGCPECDPGGYIDGDPFPDDYEDEEDFTDPIAFIPDPDMLEGK